MSYKKLESEDVSPSKSNAITSSKSPISSSPKSKSRRKKPVSSKAANTASIKAQLEERKVQLKENKSNTQTNIITAASLPPSLPHQEINQTDLDHEIALKLAKSDEYNQSIDSNIEFINNINSSHSEEVAIQNNYSKHSLKCLCVLYSRGDYITLIISPIILCFLLFIMILVNKELIIVWFLSFLTFYIVLIFCYFYIIEDDTNSILDLFTISMFYGGIVGIIGWIFGWLLAQTNNILVGPFIFMHAGFTLNSTANTVLFGTIACIMYGGIFPFVLIWLKSDKRMMDQCGCKSCKILNFNILDEYQKLQQSLNLPEHQMEQFMAANEKEIMMKLGLAQKRLRMECVSNIIGYFGCIYILSFILKFDGMDKLDTTLIFIYGYLLKDFIFGILFAIIASYVIGRRKLYHIRMNNKFMYYGLIMLLGILQQSVSTVLCGLYPHVSLRIYIIYISIGFNLIICCIALLEIFHQKKLFKVQLEALFIYNSMAKLQISDSSVRMEDLSTVTE